MTFRHTPALLALAALGLGMGLRTSRSATLTLVCPKLCAHDEAVLTAAHATFTSNPDGCTLVADEHAAVGLFRLRREYIWAAQVSEENLRNANSSLLTCDGTPYHRKFVALLPDGTHELHESAKVRYLYDPTNLRAERSGAHKGYVAEPDVYAQGEELQRHIFYASVQFYDRALRRVERMNVNLLCWHTPPIPMEECEVGDMGYQCSLSDPVIADDTSVTP